MFKLLIRVYVYSCNVFEAIFSMKFVKDKKLHCDIAQIQESMEKKVDLRWIEVTSMLADAMTKRGARPD